MKSRTNAQQELMRQQMIEEERNRQNQKCQNNRVLPQTIKCGRLLNAMPQMTAAAVTKRQRSSSDVSQLKIESFSPTNKSPMDLAFTSLANDHDVLDWSQIEPSITTTSDISPQEILEQITRSQNNDSIPEMQMETGTEENDSLQDDQSVSSLKPSTSCPANMANPFHVSSSGAPSVLIKYHQFTSQKQSNHNPPTVSSGRSSVTNPTQIVTSIPTGLPEDQKLQWVRDRTKKDCHNRIERKRRDYINNQIQELGQLLPEKLFLSTESKRNKGGILKNSVLYIQQLQDSVNCIPHLQKEAQISENLISELYKNNQSLRNLVKSNSQISCEIPVVDKKLLQDWFDTHQNNSQLLQKINSAQLPWPAENSHREKLSVYTNYDDVSVLDISAENVLNSISIPREQTINSGGASSSGTPITNYSSPITNTSTTIASSNRSRHTPVTNMTNNIITVNSPQQYQSHIYGSSQPFSKSNFRLYEQTQSKPGITDSPVLSSILIGSGNSNNGVKTFSELQSSSKHNATVIGHSSSVPDEPRIGFFSQSSENNSGERFYLIPITKAIKTKGLVKVETDFSYSEDPVISKIHSEPINSPRNKVINTYKIGQISHEEEEVHNCIEISPDQIDNDDSLMGEFEFDDIQME